MILEGAVGRSSGCAPPMRRDQGAWQGTTTRNRRSEALSRGQAPRGACHGGLHPADAAAINIFYFNAL
jgi:hypothetical protein